MDGTHACSEPVTVTCSQVRVTPLDLWRCPMGDGIVAAPRPFGGLHCGDDRPREQAPL